MASTDLLYRLFHEDGVRVFDPRPLAARCRCSAEKVSKVLAALPEAEVAGLIEDDGLVHVACEFCTTDYTFGPEDLARLYANT